MFRYASRDLVAVVHGDDFSSTARWTRTSSSRKWERGVATRATCRRSGTRSQARRAAGSGIGPKHHYKPVLDSSLLLVRRVTTALSLSLSWAEARLHRACVARVNVAFAATELCQRMISPVWADLEPSWRLPSSPLVWHFLWQQEAALHDCVDTDYARCHVT